MRKFKIFLWIFIVFLIETVVLAQLHIFEAAPSLTLAYVVCVMIMENEFKDAVTISIICAAAEGALCGRGFALTTLFYVYSSIVIFALRKKPAYVGNLPKALFWTFLASAALEIIMFFQKTFTINLEMLLHDALPTAVCNTLLALIVYPLLKVTMYKGEKKKKLLIV